ncbi:hypothetical protein KOY49_00080 [Candidatus Minimicrobia vallesae]|uniref:Uncharacterized protein n=1 Tax=Candidatus Minimicrobia vallesae TaxID=2841264 RepID=A0A8F1SAM7_9BACT|nr:hypothetical protein [Candidatus Minimicrobia vallesae]QWQ31438.1 hypothetical protein KOY49_00080 [Candidatus Minimicrobia vallesae]
MSDSEKLEAGCATISGSISCDQMHKKAVAKKLPGICIVEAEEAVSFKYGDTDLVPRINISPTVLAQDQA